LLAFSELLYYVTFI